MRGGVAKRNKPLLTAVSFGHSPAMAVVRTPPCAHIVRGHTHTHRRAHSRVHILCTAVCSPLCVHMGCARNRAHSLLLLLPLLLLMLCWYTLHCTPQVFRLHHSRPWCTTAVPNKQGRPKQATVNVQKTRSLPWPCPTNACSLEQTHTDDCAISSKRRANMTSDSRKAS